FSLLHPTSTTEIYTLSLHDALPILLRLVVIGSGRSSHRCHVLDIEDFRRFRIDQDRRTRLIDRNLYEGHDHPGQGGENEDTEDEDRKSTRLNSSHVSISYAVFCLKK